MGDKIIVTGKKEGVLIIEKIQVGWKHVEGNQTGKRKDVQTLIKSPEEAE